MAAAAVSGAKRSLRAELKQRLRAISAEERLRQSRLLTQKVRSQGIAHATAHSLKFRLARARGSAQAQHLERAHVPSGARTFPGARTRRSRLLLWRRCRHNGCSMGGAHAGVEWWSY